jgi:hypothetical protein
MQLLQSLLAEMDPETIQKINDIHDSVGNVDKWTIQLLLILTIITTLLVITIFIRQKNIAQNQIGLAEMIKQMKQQK